jgi:hydrogenase/urease accessory protein HupE
MSATSRACRLVVVASAAVLIFPMPAQAHLATTGLGPVYDGISHVLLSPEDLLPVLAMAFLAGLTGRPAGRLALLLLPLAWALGGVVAFEARASLPPGARAAASFLVLGVLTAADPRLSPGLVASLAVALGLLHGWFNGAGIAAAGREEAGLVGIAAAVFVLVAMAAAFVVSLRASWARIAVRVAGSWIAAIGLLMLGWSLHGQP